MAWIPAAGAGISAIGGLLGGKNAAKAQDASSKAAAGLYSAEEQAIQQLLNNYFQMAPGLEQSLLNFPETARKQGEGLITEFGNTLGAQDQSLINTFRSQLGGVANPGAVLLNAAQGQGENQARMGQGMEADLSSMLSGLDLQSLQQMASLISAPLASSLGGLQNIGNTYAGAAAAGGNPWAGAISGIGNVLSNWPSSTGGGGSGVPASQLNTGFNQPGGFSAPPASMFNPGIGILQPGANTNPYSNMNMNAPKPPTNPWWP